MDERARFFQALDAAHTRLTARLEAELERRVGLSLKEHQLLEALEAGEGGTRRMNELADALAMSASGLSRLADRLEQQNLVERRTCPTDLRGFFVLLTDGGRARLGAAERCRVAVLERMLAFEDLGTLDTVARALQRLSAAPPQAPP